MIVTTLLMSAALAQGSEPRLLTPAMPGSADVAAFAWMPDGQRAAFLVDRDVDEQFELYSVTTRGPLVFTPLSRDLDVGETLEPLGLEPCLFAPGGTQLVYGLQLSGFPPAIEMAQQDGSEVPLEIIDSGFGLVLAPDGSVIYERLGSGIVDLFRVDIEGGPATDLGLPGTSIGGASGHVLDATGERVVFRWARFSAHSLCSARVDGQGSTSVLFDELNFGPIPAFDLTADGTRVVFTARPFLATTTELWSVPVDGSQPATTLTASTPGEDVESDFRIDPSGTWAIYRRAERLYRVSLDGGASLPLTPEPAPGGSLAASFSGPQFWIGPDGESLVYLADLSGSGVFELDSVPLDGGPSTRLNDPLPAGHTIALSSIRISPAGVFDVPRLVFGLETDLGMTALHVVPIDGSSPAQELTPPFVSGGHVVFSELPGNLGRNYEIGPLGRKLIYLADAVVDEQVELFSVSLLGGPARKLSGTMIPEGDVERFRPRPGGGPVLFSADRQTDDVVQLYVSSPGRSLEKSSPPTRSRTRSLP